MLNAQLTLDRAEANFSLIKSEAVSCDVGVDENKLVILMLMLLYARSPIP